MAAEYLAKRRTSRGLETRVTGHPLRTNSMPGQNFEASGQGQFDDAEDSKATRNALDDAITFDTRRGVAFIDEDDAADFGSDYSVEGEEDSGYDSQLEREAWADSLTRVDDEDWEIAETGVFSISRI